MDVTCLWGAVYHDCMQGSCWAVCRDWYDTEGIPRLSWDFSGKASSLAWACSLVPALFKALAALCPTLQVGRMGYPCFISPQDSSSTSSTWRAATAFRTGAYNQPGQSHFLQFSMNIYAICAELPELIY